MQKFEIQGEITDTEGGAALPVQLNLESPEDKVVGKSEDVIYIDLAAEANPKTVDENLSQFLSRKLQIGSSKIAVASGISLQRKVVIIMGLMPLDIEERLFA